MKGVINMVGNVGPTLSPNDEGGRSGDTNLMNSPNSLLLITNDRQLLACELKDIVPNKMDSSNSSN